MTDQYPLALLGRIMLEFVFGLIIPLFIGIWIGRRDWGTFRTILTAIIVAMICYSILRGLR